MRDFHLAFDAVDRSLVKSDGKAYGGAEQLIVVGEIVYAAIVEIEIEAQLLE